MAKSFLERVQPNRQRWKMVEWPFSVDGDESAPKVKLRVLSQADAEAAHLATVDHFKAVKPPVRVTDAPFAVRERAEMVFRAFSIEGETLAADIEELVEQPMAVIDELHSTWAQFQNDVCAAPHTAKDMDALVALLKKNTPAGHLAVLSSSWLIALITILVSQLPPSTPDSERG